MEGAEPLPQPEASPQEPQVSPDLVVAIDFGTFRSALVFYLPKVSGRRFYRFLKWPSATLMSVKGPTRLYLCKDTKTNVFESIGFGYTSDICDPGKETVVTETGFKMKLNNVLTEQRVPVSQCVRDFLKLLFVEAEKFFYGETGKRVEDFEHVRWCLTMPAIWKFEDDMFMAQAMFDTNLLKSDPTTAKHSKELLMVLEPEAAMAQFVRYAKNNKKGRKIDWRNKTVLVVDAGGGTIDMTVHTIVCKKQEKCQGSGEEEEEEEEEEEDDDDNEEEEEEDEEDYVLNEVIPGKGNHFGGDSINREFFKHCELSLGKPWSQFKTQKRAWWKFQQDFETQKCLIEGYTDTWIAITKRLYERFENSAIPAKLKVTNDEGIYRLVISADNWRSYYERCIQDLTSKIHEVFTEAHGKGSPINHIYLVGGFARSPILQDAVRDLAIGKLAGNGSCITPGDPEESIVIGACHVGKRPSILNLRVARETWGIAVNVKTQDFPSHEVGSERIWKNPITGEKWVTGVFHELTRAGEEHEYDSYVETVIETVYPNQKYLSLSFYSLPPGTAKPPEFVDSDFKTQKRGQIFAKIPPPPEDCVKNRRITLRLYFGMSSLQASAFVDEGTKQLESYGKIEGKAIFKTNTIFVVDNSLSMTDADDAEPSVESRWYDTDQQCNRLGAAFEAIETFIGERERLRGKDKEMKYSVVGFSEAAQVLLEHGEGSDVPESLAPLVPEGHQTNYSAALKAILEHNLLIDEGFVRNDIIFLSDGDVNADVETLDDTLLEILNSGKRFVTLHTVHLGSEGGKERLRDMARQGGGIYGEANNLTELLLAFQLLGGQPV